MDTVGICKKEEQKGVALFNDNVDTIAVTALQTGSGAFWNLASRDCNSSPRGDVSTRLERNNGMAKGSARGCMT